MEINKESLFQFLIYDKPFPYSKNISVYPVTMENALMFQILSKSITVRKNSTFREKKIIKMSYLEFLIYAFGNAAFEEQYNIPGLSQYFFHAVQLLQLCCKDSKISMKQDGSQININGEEITPQKFDDLRRIILIQNGIDFDIDEFLNYDTEQRLLKAENDQSKNKKSVNMEDYIDSLVVALNITEEQIMNMTIRKFWRYVNRYRLYENYTLMKTGECSGMVKYKEPIEYWMLSLDEDDKYKNLKTDEESLRSKVG